MKSKSKSRPRRAPKPRSRKPRAQAQAKPVTPVQAPAPETPEDEHEGNGIGQDFMSQLANAQTDNAALRFRNAELEKEIEDMKTLLGSILDARGVGLPGTIDHRIRMTLHKA